MNKTVDEAIIAYLSGSIDDASFELLDRQLREDPTAAQRFAEICDSDLALASVLRLEQARPKSKHVRAARREKHSYFWRYSVTAAAMIALVGFVWLAARSSPSAPDSTPIVASIKSVEGVATLQSLGSNSFIAALVGAPLHLGDSVHVYEQGKFTIAFTDGTTISTDGATDFILTPAENKKVTLTRGAIVADVAAQPLANPMQFITAHAQADVVGTQLRVDVRDGSTTLIVAAGKVRFTRRIDKQSLLIQSGYTATAAANDSAPLTQRTLKTLRDELPKNAEVLFAVTFADRPMNWGGEFGTPSGSPDGAIAMGSNQFQPGTRFYGEIRSPLFETGLDAGPNTYLRFRYRTQGLKAGDLIKLMLKKKDGSIFHGFVQPEYRGWSVATLRVEREFLDLENGAKPLSARDTLNNFVFLGAAPDGTKAKQGPRLWIDEVLIFNTAENVSVSKVSQ